MKCNWCGKGNGKNYTKDKAGKIHYYYCIDCVGDKTNDFDNTLKVRETDISRKCKHLDENNQCSHDNVDSLECIEQEYNSICEIKDDCEHAHLNERASGDNIDWCMGYLKAVELMTESKKELIAEFIEFLGYYMHEWNPQLSREMARELREEYKKWEGKLQ